MTTVKGTSQKSDVGFRERLVGVDAPERRGASACEKQAAVRARDFVTAWVAAAGPLTLSGVRRGKYASRVLGRVTAPHGDLSAALLASGLARPYQGTGPRPPWC